MKTKKDRLRLRNSERYGFTMIELVVVMGIIGALIGLILPAVQASRESARRAQCANNLKQLMIATHSFAEARGGFPSSAFWGRTFTRYDHGAGIYSLQCSLLPYLDQGALYNSMNFLLISGSFAWLEQYHRTAATQVLGTFLCPSDRFATRSIPFAGNSYRECTGLGEATLTGNELHLISDGAFMPLDDGTSRVLNLAAIRDGLSSTLAFSEKPIGSGASGGVDPFRDWIASRLTGNDWTSDAWLNRCSNLSPDELAGAQGDGGGSWMIPGAIYTAFYASAPPNSRVPDCGISGINNGLGIFAARSYHPGGVNAVMADGSIHWFTSGIDARIWRSLGTRAGGEIAGVVPE
jgi:prepilin-type N-terminal cleavage/methylation domain-containing protein/prepilin-type processing-associated H-X9-DG protein